MALPADLKMTLDVYRLPDKNERRPQLVLDLSPPKDGFTPDQFLDLRRTLVSSGIMGYEYTGISERIYTEGNKIRNDADLRFPYRFHFTTTPGVNALLEALDGHITNIDEVTPKIDIARRTFDSMREAEIRRYTHPSQREAIQR